MKTVKNEEYLRTIEDENLHYATKDIYGYIILNKDMTKVFQNNKNLKFYVGESYYSKIETDIFDVSGKCNLNSASPSIEYILTRMRWNELIMWKQSSIMSIHPQITKYQIYATQKFNGFVSFVSLQGALELKAHNFNSSIFKILIPKGSWYYNGETNYSEYECYMSDQMKIVEKLAV